MVLCYSSLNGLRHGQFWMRNMKVPKMVVELSPFYLLSFSYIVKHIFSFQNKYTVLWLEVLNYKPGGQKVCGSDGKVWKRSRSEHWVFSLHVMIETSCLSSDFHFLGQYNLATSIFLDFYPDLTLRWLKKSYPMIVEVIYDFQNWEIFVKVTLCSIFPIMYQI